MSGRLSLRDGSYFPLPGLDKRRLHSWTNSSLQMQKSEITKNFNSWKDMFETLMKSIFKFWFWPTHSEPQRLWVPLSTPSSRALLTPQRTRFFWMLITSSRIFKTLVMSFVKHFVIQNMLIQLSYPLPISPDEIVHAMRRCKSPMAQAMSEVLWCFCLMSGRRLHRYNVLGALVFEFSLMVLCFVCYPFVIKTFGFSFLNKAPSAARREDLLLCPWLLPQRQAFGPAHLCQLGATSQGSLGGLGELPNRLKDLKLIQLKDSNGKLLDELNDYLMQKCCRLYLGG